MQQKDFAPKISVIIPVYNIEPYLKWCIDSVIGQTLEDIEIILVDDGSTDRSGCICDEYAANDARIRVIHKQNEGLSAARNAGLTASKAPYIMFVDGDDWVEYDFCETPYRIAVKNNVDVVLFGYNSVFNDGRIAKIETQAKRGELSEAEALRFNVYCACFAWMGLYRRELFDGIRFPIGVTHEDVGTTHRLIHAAHKIYLINDHLYNYRMNRPGSITTSWNDQSHLDVKEMLTRKTSDLCNWGYEELAQKDALTLMVKYGWRRPDQKSFVEIVRKIKGLGPNEFDWRQKLFVALLKISPWLFDAACVATRKRIG